MPLYEELEATAGFIREEGHQLIDAELRYYQPFYRQIFTHTEAMNRWGIGLFIINTLLSIDACLLAIARHLPKPIKKLGSCSESNFPRQLADEASTSGGQQ